MNSEEVICKAAGESPANGVSSVHPTTADAFKIFLMLKDEYGIWICPNSGTMKEAIFRAGHLGSLASKDNDRLFYDMQKRGCYYEKFNKSGRVF